MAALLGVAMITNPCIGMADDSTVKVGYKNGFFIQDGEDFLLRTGARLQARMTYEKPDGGDKEAFFNVPRARLAFSGHAFSEDWTYKFQTDFGKGQASLKDFYVDYAASKEVFHIRVGQQKRPFSRQFLSSSSKLLFVDRAPTTKAFGLGRDIGVVFHNNMTKSPTFEWALGIVNGDGVKSRVDVESTGSIKLDENRQIRSENEIKDDNLKVTVESDEGEVTNSIDHFEPAVVLRLGYNHGNLKGYSEADLEGGGLRFGIALGTYATFDTDDDRDAFVKTTLDTMIKVQGFAFSGAFFLQMDQDGDSFTEQKMGLKGAVGQVSYAIGEKYVPAARFTWLDGKDEETAEDKTVMEIAGGFSAFFFKHKVKWQTDVAVAMTKVDGESTKDIVGRTQLQFNF